MALKYDLNGIFADLEEQVKKTQKQYEEIDDRYRKKQKKKLLIGQIRKIIIVIIKWPNLIRVDF